MLLRIMNKNRTKTEDVRFFVTMRLFRCLRIVFFRYNKEVLQECTWGRERKKKRGQQKMKKLKGLNRLITTLLCVVLVIMSIQIVNVDVKAAGKTQTFITTQECSIWSRPNTSEEYRVKKIPAGHSVTVYMDVIPSERGDGKTFYKTAKGCYILCKCFQTTGVTSPTRIWNGTVDKSWYTGDKTSYDISTPEQLAGFSELVRDGAHADRFRGITINLVSDIVLNDTSKYASWKTSAPKNVWDPIGQVGGPIRGYFPFAGVFNGNGHTITGMYTNCDENAGLFCYTSGAVVTNLKFEKCLVISSGGAAGTVVGLSENSYFENIEVNNAVVIARGDRWAAAGGIVGRAEVENNISVLSYSLLLSCGVVVNPILWFNSDVDKKPAMYGTYVVNGKVNASEIRSEGRIYADCAGGIIGAGRQAVALYNCLVTNTNFASYTSFGRGEEGKYGGVIGCITSRGGDQMEHIIKNCYVSNIKRVDKYSGKRTDSNLAPAF